MRLEGRRISENLNFWEILTNLHITPYLGERKMAMVFWKKKNKNNLIKNKKKKIKKKKKNKKKLEKNNRK